MSREEGYRIMRDDDGMIVIEEIEYVWEATAQDGTALAITGNGVEYFVSADDDELLCTTDHGEARRYALSILHNGEGFRGDDA